MSTSFIAVQCYQCSTMQVKQRKKSSNKWNCVVCNEKQSIRKVFAQSFMAKDVRLFVQTFNMSRQFADQQSLNEETLIPQSEEIDTEFQRNMDTKKITDWSEYLDPEEKEPVPNYLKNDGDSEDEFGKKFMTELPKAMFKKPKLMKKNSDESDKEDGEKLFRPVFSKRNGNKCIKPPGKSKYGETMAQATSKLGDCIKKSDWEIIGDKVAGRQRFCAAAGTSDWSEYINTNDELEDRNKRGFERDAKGGWNNAEFEGITLTNGEKVEDDIHPDFQ